MDSRPKIDYQSIFPLEKELSPAEKRRLLVEKIEKGISYEVGHGTVSFQLREKTLRDGKILVGIDIMNATKKIAWVEAERYPDKPEADKMAKYYSENADEEYKKKGLISAATSLLFQVLQERGVNRVVGRIETDNVSSINSRLKTRDLVHDGYYQTTIRPIESTVPSWRKSAKENYEVTTILDDTISRDTPLTFQEALAG